MNKTKFDGFINRYSLGGEIESVMINVGDGKVSTQTISDDKTLLGFVEMEEDSLPDGNFGIYTTSQLKSLLGVLDNNISVTSTDSSLSFKDEVSDVQYMRAQESVIPKAPDLKVLPDFNISIDLDGEFVSRFVKSTSALSDAKKFTFISKNGKSEIILGYSTTNTNRISIAVNATVEGDVDPISFSASYLRAILMNNRGNTEASLKIATDGLCEVSFSGGDYTSKYYIVEIKA